MAEESNNVEAGNQTSSHPAEQALEQAQQATDALRAETDGTTGGGAEPAAFDLPDVNGAPVATATAAPVDLALLNDVALNVKIELGRTRMYVEDVLQLTPESVIELDKAAGDPVDIFVNERLVARGEVLVLNENFCVRVSEIVDHLETES